MGNDPKFIVFDEPTGGETAIVFPAHIGHDRMATLLGWDVLSAGFVSLKNGPPVLYGASTTLKVSADPKYTTMVRRQLMSWDPYLDD